MNAADVGGLAQDLHPLTGSPSYTALRGLTVARLADLLDNFQRQGG